MGNLPQSLQSYNQLKKESNWQLTLPFYDETYAHLCNRQTAAICLRSLFQFLPSLNKKLLPRFRSSIQEIETILHEEQEVFLLKAPYSSSGRGLLRVANKLRATDKQWISGILKKQGNISIELFLDKQLDFALEFFSTGKGNIFYEGLSLFHTTKQGKYLGNTLNTQEKIEKQITSFISQDLLNRVRDALSYILQDTISYLYEGYLGIDMMIYKDLAGTFHLHPCVEINMRHTMGIVALFFSNKYLAETSEGILRIEYYPTSQEAYQKHLTLEKTYPVHVEDGKIQSGYLALCPVTKQNKYLAYVNINSH